MAESKMRSLVLAMMATTAATMLAGCAAETEEEEVAESESSIIGGSIDNGHPAVGYLQFSVNGTGSASCTATLVAPKLLLTAAHCVVGANGEKLDNYRISFATRPSAGPSYKATATIAHPGYSPKVFGTHDVAVVVLEAAPPIKPMPVQKAALGNVLGKPLTHVGTGTTAAAGSLKYGAGEAKKKVTLRINQQTAQTLRTGEQYVQGGICSGDSGGPATMSINGVETVVAVHSYVDDGSFCLNHGFSTRTDSNMDFLARYL